jgi:dTDP-D-glucose 4,6-dehydratase
MQSFEIDTVMHFAAQSHVDASFGNSIEFTKVRTTTRGCDALPRARTTLT